MRTTSRGMATIVSPLRLNMTTMVNSSAARVMGLMRGMKADSYQCRPLTRNRTRRVAMPPKKGIPR